MPYLVAIAAIPTNFFRQPCDAKGRAALAYSNRVPFVVAKVFQLKRNAALQLAFYTALVLVENYSSATHLVLP
jgi:hypothetical protein